MSEAAPLSAAKLALLGRSLWGRDGDVIRSEPIAIVGMACRFPGGANSPEELWALLLAGADVVSEVPADRWDADAWFAQDPATPGRMNTRWGGFLEDVRGFDAAFFDISPREAERMDPQQRLALEVACEAIERAGVPFDQLRGAAAGVFFASYHNDYTLLQYTDPDTVTARTLTGALHAIVANRISYVLGLTGPSLAIDCACSSSLVATHLACQALRSRDCDLALAGGVSAMLTPHVTVALSKGGFMSPTGRCHTFDASADGFVRAEGCGVIVLKRFADAIAAGDHVLGVIRGSAVNQDGESTTLSAPNGLAQADLVRRALAHAGLKPEHVSLIEAHGTGTELGDPIETDALAAVFNGRDPAAGPCWVGSLKSNVGHLEAAAGVGGLIKTVLCLQHGTIPPHALFRSLNRHIDFTGGPLRVATEAMPWTVPGSRIGGVSSFGVGGTNAHVLVEEAPALAREPLPDEAPHLLALSARSERALRELCGRYAARLHDGADVSAVCRAAARRRTHHREWRVALVVPSAAALAAQLEEIADGTRALQPAPARERICFVFTGQGQQWPGMAAALAEREPAFRSALAEAADAVRSAGGPDVLVELARPAAETRLEDTDVAQAAIFAVQHALTRLLAAHGIRPAAVIGHSIGELAAAVAAGMIDLPTAAIAVVARGRLMQATFDLGRMVSVRATEAAVREFVVRHGLALAIAAVNGPTAVVLSGATAEVERALRALAAEGIEHTSLNVRFAFHSPLMNDAASALREAAATVQGSAGATPFFSSVTGAALPRIDGDYLADNIRSPVRFAAAVEAALDAGITHFIEVGAHPALGRGILELAQARALEAGTAFCLHRERADRLTLRTMLGQAYGWGSAIAWENVFPGPVPAVTLPTYAWQHVPYWLPEAPDLRRPGHATRPASRGFPGSRLASPALPGPVFELHLQDAPFRSLLDHRIGGEPRLPATAFAELIRSAGVAAGLAQPEVRALGILRPVALDRDARVQLVLSPRDAGFAVEVFVGGEREWQPVATADLAEVASHTETAAPVDAGVELSVDGFYELLSAQGCDFGASFRLLRAISVEGDVATGAIDAAAVSAWQDGLHPALVDAAAQLCVAVLQARGYAGPEAFLPWSIDSYRVTGAGLPSQARVALVDAGADGATFDVHLLDSAGMLVASLAGWRLRRTATSPAALRTVAWRPQAAAAAAPAGAAKRWLVFPDRAGLLRGLGDALVNRGRDVTFVLADNGDDGATEAVAALEREPHAWEGILYAADAHGLSDAAEAARVSGPLLAVARTLAAAPRPARLVVLTRATQAVGGLRRGGEAAAAAATGLLRALRAEVPEVACTVLDLDFLHEAERGGPRELEAVLLEALTTSRDAEVALRDGVRFVAQPALTEATGVAASLSGPSVLVHRGGGTLDGFELVPAEVTAPAAGEVRIRVLAAGINFRDVLTALGSYPGARELGHECCGVVDAVGEGVITPAVGTRVVAFWPGCFGNFVNVPAAFVLPIPATLDPAAAASLPVAFGTAWYALHEIGTITAGDAVLIHAGAGGVGLAAIQLAQAAGATVYATAGTPEKRALLARLGVAGVFDSRSSSFAPAVLAATDGAGVQLVLNSLIGDLIPAGFRALRPGGVFVELGKREILSAEAVSGLRADVRYRAFDLGEEAHADAGLLPRIFALLGELLQAGRIRPLPVSVHALADAGSAFRRMARAEHIGKLVLVPPPLPERALVGWNVVTGGTGGVGMATVRWLAARGAKHIAVWSRRAPSPEVTSELATFAGQIDIRVQSVDVSVSDQVSTALADLRAAAPITAVYHGAGMVDDAMLAQQSPERFASVLSAKCDGAWNLHVGTAADPIEQFVLYSAAGPVIDARGQANYAAANAVLDALAVQRRAHGLPGVSVLWGPWGDAGMAARLSDAQRDRWSRHGLDWWSSTDASAAFDALRGDVPPQVLAIRSRAASARVPGAAGTKPPARAGLRTALENAASGARHSLLLEHVTTTLTGVLGLAVPPPPDTPLRDAGMDSLSAIELRNALTLSVGVSLPATLAFDHPSAAAITTFLLRTLALDAAPAPGESAPAAAARDVLLEEVQALSDEEAEALLLQELGLGDAAEAR